MATPEEVKWLARFNHAEWQGSYESNGHKWSPLELSYPLVHTIGAPACKLKVSHRQN